MGLNLARSMSDKGYHVTLFDLHAPSEELLEQFRVRLDMKMVGWCLKLPSSPPPQK